MSAPDRLRHRSRARFATARPRIVDVISEKLPPRSFMVMQVLRDYLLKRGPLGPWHLLAKLFGMVIHYRAHRRWVRVLASPVTRPILANHPRVAYRHLSEYLFSGLDWLERVELLTSHYRFLNLTQHSTLVLNLLRPEGGITLWESQCDQMLIAIRLRGPGAHREGEVNMSLYVGEVPVCGTGFSVLPRSFFGDQLPVRSDPPAQIFYIAHMQAAPNERDRIQVAARLCQQVTAQDMLMTALAALATFWEIDELMAVSIGRHIAHAKLKELPQAFDYTKFWTRYGASRTSDDHFAIGLPYPVTPIDIVPARRRKTKMQQRAFKSLIHHEVPQRLAAFAQSRTRAEKSGNAVERKALQPFSG